MCVQAADSERWDINIWNPSGETDLSNPAWL